MRPRKNKKLRVAVIFGGKSAEHEVSLQSGRNVINSLDKNKYDLVLIGIDKQGKWFLFEDGDYLVNADDTRRVGLSHKGREVVLIPGRVDGRFLAFKDGDPLDKIDVVFPVLHGTFGEDGGVQGLLKVLDVAYVGADVLGSAVGMDKIVSKRLLREDGIKIANFLIVERGDDIGFGSVKERVGLPFFVKPSNLGSSVGVSKVHDESEFEEAIEEAFKYDNRIVIEEFIDGAEVFCAVLGNEKPIVSVPGMLETDHEFYDYEAKYVDEVEMEIPLKASGVVKERLQDISIRAYKALCCEGMARVDLFLTEKGDVYVNEINTISGFTSHSWYPKLWEASGVKIGELLDKLIELGIERYEKQILLKTSL